MGGPPVSLAEYSSSEEELDGFSPHAAAAVTWTRKQLTLEDGHVVHHDLRPVISSTK
jgi:hypothetical protein